jgi:hypothetical protein
VNWQQFRAIVWLRWRLSRNQFIRGGQFNAFLSVFFMAVMFLLAAGLTVGAAIGGWFLGTAKQVPAPILLLVWDGAVFLFLVFWFSGLMVEIQRSESVDLEKLLRLPVTLQQVFVFNFAASHFTPSIIILVPPFLGLCLGLALGGGWLLALIAPVLLTFIFAVSSWTYCLRGWLAALMVNKRRRRAVLVWITIVFVLLAQTPNLVFNSHYFRNWAHPKSSAVKSRNGASQNKGKEEFILPEPVLQAHLALPPGWIGYSAMSLRERNAFPAVATTVGAFLIGVLGLMRAYRVTLRFYLGAEAVSKRHAHEASSHGRQLAQEPVPQGQRGLTSPAAPLLVERTIPWLRDDTAALALATLRSILRAPELKMALIMPIVMGAVMMSIYFKRPRAAIPESFSGFITAAAVAAAAFSLVPTMSNIFGLDRNGFRTLVLLPTERRKILLAKNLAVFPLLGAVSVGLLVMVKVMLQLPWLGLVAGLLQAPAAFLLFSLLCNQVSILAPYRLAQGTLQAKKPKAIIFVAVFASFFVLPFIMIPILIPAGLQLIASGLDWPSWVPVNVLATLAVLAGAIWLYAGLLPSQGRLLQKREQKILKEVTEEIE